MFNKLKKNDYRRSLRRRIAVCFVFSPDLLFPAFPHRPPLPTCFFLALGWYNMLTNGLGRTCFPSVLDLVLSLRILAFLTGSLEKLFGVVQPGHYGLWGLLRLQPQH